jgi:hypothetical protein
MTELSGGDPNSGRPAVAPPIYPQPGYRAYPPSGYGGYPHPGLPTKSLRGLAIATQILLAIQLLAAIALLFPVLHERNLIQRIKSDPRSVTLAEAARADNTVNALNGLVLVLYIATGVVWIIWFYRARTNTDAWPSDYQRRRAGWAIGGWFCPIVNFWFPYMMAKDILDDTEADVNRGRATRPLVVIWWLGFLALLVGALVQRGRGDAQTIDDFTGDATLNIVSVVIRILAIVPAFYVVRQITNAQSARIQRDANRPAG